MRQTAQGKELISLLLDKEIVAALRKAALTNKRKLNAQVEIILGPALLKENR